MPKPTTVKLVGTFEMPDTCSLAVLHEALSVAQAALTQRIGPGTLTLKLGPGTLTLKLGRQELRA